MNVSLVKEFERIRHNHRQAIRHRAARVILFASVIRVFESGTKDRLLPILAAIPIDEIATLNDESQFKLWFEGQLNILAQEIKRCNPNNTRIYPGYKWGHATKLLTLYIREMVLNSRYFPDSVVRRVSPWLYVPIDSVGMKRLRQLGSHLPFARIKEIDSPEKFYTVQDLLGQAARRVDVPRVWFDDNWGERQ